MVPCRNKFLFWHYCSFIPEPKPSHSFERLEQLIVSFPEWCEVIMKVLSASLHIKVLSWLFFPWLSSLFYSSVNHHPKPSRHVLLSSFYLSLYLLFSHNIISFTRYNKQTIYSKEKSWCHRLWKTCTLQLLWVYVVLYDPCFYSNNTVVCKCVFGIPLCDCVCM